MNQHNLYKLKLKKEKITILLVQIFSVIMIFSLWEILAQVNVLDKFLFSCPSEIFNLLIANIKSNEIFIHIGYSLPETLIALFIGFFVLIKKKNFSNLPIERETNIMFDVVFRGISITSNQVPFKIDEKAFITIRNIPYTKLKINSINGSPRMTYVSAKNNQGYIITQDVATPGLYDFVVRLEDRAKKTPDGFVVGGNKIKMGMPIVIEGELYKYQGTVSNVFEVTEKNED